MGAGRNEQYFAWLYQQVCSARLTNPARSYRSLLGHLHQVEFVWLISNDDNRVEDGRDLRNYYLDEFGLPDSQFGMPAGCSVLEMLIALSRRLAFQADGEPRDWFWHFMGLMDLQPYTDKHFDIHAKEFVDEALQRVMYREYQPNGSGGLFPLQRPDQDQRQVELWTQMSSYLAEIP